MAMAELWASHLVLFSLNLDLKLVLRNRHLGSACLCFNGELR